MQALLLSVFLFLNSFILQNDFSYRVHDLRHYLERGAKDKDACEKLVAHLSDYKGKDPVVLGFEAAAQGIMAKHAWSPYYKIKYLHNSAAMFEKVIRSHPNVPEVHFLRYTVEFFVPRYLNLSGHLDVDKKVFLESMFRYPKSDLDAEAMQIMKRFLLRHPEHLTEEEKRRVAQLKI